MNRPAVEFPKLKIGYLPFYVDYYEGICADFPVEKAANSARMADALKEHGEVCWDGQLIRSAEQAQESGRQLALEKPDCVVVFTSIAVFGGIPWAALREIEAPVLIWNAQQIKTVGENYTMLEIVRNTGQIGTQALANTLLREGRWFRVVTGFEKSARTLAELASFFSIVRAAQGVRDARLLALGESFPGMTDIACDEEVLQTALGITVHHVSTEKLTARYREIGSVAQHAAELPARCEIEELSPIELVRSILLSETLESFVQETAADAGSFNCHGGTCLRNPEIGVTACYSLGVQNRAGRPFTCTGDLPTAIAMLILKRLTGIAMYTEVQVMDEVRGAVVIANSGEGEDAIRRPDCPEKVRGNMNFTGVHGRGASFAYSLQPGLATLVSFTPTPSGAFPFRLIAAEGEILEETLPDAGALAGFFRFSHLDLHAGYTRWLEAGAVHHAATTCGHWRRELAAVCELLEIEFITF